MPAGFPSKGENINHFAGVRLRMLGTGSVKLKFLTLPNNLGIKKEVNLVDLDLNTLNQQREPLKKTNITTQRAQLEIKTLEINEIIKINRLVIFARPVAVNFPG